MAKITKPGNQLKLAEIPAHAGHEITCGRCETQWISEPNDFFLPQTTPDGRTALMVRCPTAKCGSLNIYVIQPKSNIIAPPKGLKIH